MRLLFVCAVLIVLTSGCLPAPVTPIDIIQYPPTWTPRPPTDTPTPRPTATLVIKETSTPNAPALSGNARHLPASPVSRIGVWLDTTDLSAQAISDYSSYVQLAAGPHALALKELNPAATAIITIELQAVTDRIATSSLARNLDPLADGVLAENIGVGVQQPFETTQALLNTLRAAVAPRLLVASTYAWQDGAAYAAHEQEAQQLLENVDGVCLCDFLRDPASSPDTFKDEAGWKKDVDTLGVLSASPNKLVLTSTPFSNLTQNQSAVAQSWLGYALGSFLLGVNNSHSFFSLQSPGSESFVADPAFSAKLGEPLGPYYQTFGLYQRRFEHALVVVNPSSSTKVLPLARNMQTLSRDTLTSAALQPHTGMILLIPS